MNERIGRLWIDALRSGKYEQGFGALNRNGKFCCLGVLCEVAIAEGIKLEVGNRSHPSDDATEFVYYDGRNAALPIAVREWAEMYSEIGIIDLSVEPKQILVVINDSRNVDFNEIADVIERNIKFL